MNQEDVEKVVMVLKRLKTGQWEEILENVPEAEVAIKSSHTALKEALGTSSKTTNKMICSDIINFYGDRLLSDSKFGPLLREHILRAIPKTQWESLRKLFWEIYPDRSRLRKNATQKAKGSEVMAGTWKAGSKWPKAFCECLGLPNALAASQNYKLKAMEKVNPVVTLKALHDYQEDVYQKLKIKLSNGRGEAAMLSLPTGAGKTRVAVDAICDHLAESFSSSPKYERDIVLWISQSHELLSQAWESFRGVWQVPPMKKDGIEPVRRSNPMKIIRAWQSIDPSTVLQEIEFDTESTRNIHVIIAGIDQLHSWLRTGSSFYESLNSQSHRICCCAVDEAHGLITHEFAEVFEALSLKKEEKWESLPTSPLVIGLTATPWRANDLDTKKLNQYFQGNMLRPDELKNKPILQLRKKGILAGAEYEKMTIVGTPRMTPQQMNKLKQFNEIPPDYLKKLGSEHKRNGEIIKRLIELPTDSKVLVFTCSVEHAHTVSMTLNKHFGSGSAAVVSGETPRAQRVSIIDKFRSNSECRFLCNYGVLTTGFDAPKIDVVCITRPTMSALLYEQMVGRGLRGPKNGGTETCLILDVQDEGLPSGIQSYGRVIKQWE